MKRNFPRIEELVDVLKVKRLLETTNVPAVVLAARFGCSDQHIHAIVKKFGVVRPSEEHIEFDYT